MIIRYYKVNLAFDINWQSLSAYGVRSKNSFAACTKLQNLPFTANFQTYPKKPTKIVLSRDKSRNSESYIKAGKILQFKHRLCLDETLWAWIKLYKSKRKWEEIFVSESWSGICNHPISILWIPNQRYCLIVHGVLRNFNI